MASVNKLYRNFIILQEENRSSSSTADKSLSGYSKIEAKADRCKVSFYAQNLNNAGGQYNLLLICNKKDMRKIIDLGSVTTSENGKLDITKEFWSDNIAGLDVGYDKISGAAIARKTEDEAIFILYGFINGEQPGDNWKEYKILTASEDSAKEKIEKREEKKKTEHRKDKKEHRDDNNGEDVKKNDTLDNPVITENIRGKFEDYENNIANNEEYNPANFQVRGSVGEYFESIARGFEHYRGGFEDVKYCKWYKVPVNDLYEMCNMSNYNRYTVAYYPMLNYYPYIKKSGYFMLGYKCDKEGNLKYIAYGIPGTRSMDDQPYEGKTGFVTWIKDSEGNGNWVMFYDFKNSTVVVPMQ